MNQFFIFHPRLGIRVPTFEQAFDTLASVTQQQILLEWEGIRGSIPDRIAVLEQEINDKQAQLSEENDFGRSCQLNTEIAELASIINDLWLWFRTNQEVAEKAHQA